MLKGPQVQNMYVRIKISLYVIYSLFKQLSYDPLNLFYSVPLFCFVLFFNGFCLKRSQLRWNTVLVSK